ncbi:complement C1q-like protein 2 [Mya arenaria]|uniref:complement C1q-like protein 2 n=1 Tax=Mya arenaria TaxID=6604 RepID=UPI0022E69F5D|nr:complement C1q-like protein 2 [Mya arenaria]
MADQVPAVNFVARSPQTSNLSTSEVIVYKTVETNQGNGYSSTTDKFTAAVRGLYLFFMHTCVPVAKFAFLQIMKEGSALIASSQHESDYTDCSSSQVFVQLDAGETVWVQCSLGSSNVQLFENSYHWTSFGGAIIFT